MTNVVELPQLKPTMNLTKLVAQCRKHCRAGLALVGLDPLTAMRCRALLYAHTALAAIDDADSEKARLGLERMADAYLHVHDQLAGLRWFSWPSTVRAARRDTLRALDGAMTRAELRRIAEALSQKGAKSRPKLVAA